MEPEKQYSEILESAVTEIQTARISIARKVNEAGIGVSSRNLWDMKRFYEHYKNASPKLRRCVAVLPWKHNLLILSKTNSLEEAEFYASKVAERGWTRDILLNYIKADAFTNEKRRIKSPKRRIEQYGDFVDPIWSRNRSQEMELASLCLRARNRNTNL